MQSAEDPGRAGGEGGRRRGRWAVLLRMSFGVMFLILGFAGLFLPLLQGVIFLAVGIALLADHIPLFARIRGALYRRYPRLEHAVRRIHGLRKRKAGGRRGSREGGAAVIDQRPAACDKASPD